MVINTKHGEFECKDITRKKRRELYKEVKIIYENQPIKQEDIHNLADKFSTVAFGSEEEIEKALGKYTALQEDEILMEIINAYMGFKGNISGD